MSHPKVRLTGKDRLLQQFHTYGLELLRKTPVISVPEFEKALHQRFKKDMIDEDYETITGSSRLRWKNLADWVKAYLTKEDLIQYRFIRGVKFILFLEPIGTLLNTPLCNYRHACHVVDCLYRACNPPHGRSSE